MSDILGEMNKLRYASIERGIEPSCFVLGVANFASLVYENLEWLTSEENEATKAFGLPIVIVPVMDMIEIGYDDWHKASCMAKSEWSGE